ncbi:MAG: DUF4249 domain-containing protein [Ginsengibacter sp.]
MKKLLNILTGLVLINSNFLSCKRPYEPPAVKVDNRFLAIDATLVSSPDSPSVFTLSRTVKLTDTTQAINPESGAIVSVEDNTGRSFSFFEKEPGKYVSAPLSLDASQKYRLKISTSSGQYTSDFVNVEQTPPIDSITWKQQNDVMIFLNTHDLSNNTRYYRWDFTETWQYTSPLDAELSQNNGIIFYVDGSNQTHTCWQTNNSTQLLTGTSIALSEDVINQAPIATVPQNSEKISSRYSILVKQYALSEKAYQYFQVLKKTTENLGSIFDAQPTQLIGNIHSVSNPTEVVIGFFTASSVTQKRIFISKNEVTDWSYVYSGRECGITTISTNRNIYEYNFPDTSFAPYYYGSATTLFIARKECVDCRTQGGVNKKPSYW